MKDDTPIWDQNIQNVLILDMNKRDKKKMDELIIKLASIVFCQMYWLYYKIEK